MTVFIALLRGINVGGNRIVGMAALKVLFESLGFEGVRTHLNSGNVIFGTKQKSGAKLTKRIEASIEKTLGFRPAVIVRSAAEVKSVIAKNPFPHAAKDDPGHLLVMFLARKPEKDAAARLAEAYSGAEEIRIDGETVYLTYPNGIGPSKLTNTLLEKHLGTAGTARNWNTLTKLVELAKAP